MRNARSSSCPKTARHFPALVFNLSPSHTCLCRAGANTLTPRDTQKRTHRASISWTTGGTAVCLSPCLSLSVILCLSLPFSLPLPLPSLLCLSSTTCPSGHTYTHAHTQTGTHAGLLCPRLTDQQHHGDLSTRRTLFAESRWSEKDKNMLLTGLRPNWWAKGQRE